MMGSASVATVALSLSLLLLPALGRSAELRDHLYGVRALSATEAWAVGNFGTIEHTTDGGATWKSVDAEIRRPIFGIDFGDPEHAWAVGKSALVLRSDDGGKTWKEQSTPLSIEKHLFKVKALDKDTAWAVGDWGTIVTTSDGGATWQDRSLGVVGGDDGSPVAHGPGRVVVQGLHLEQVLLDRERRALLLPGLAAVLRAQDEGGLANRPGMLRIAEIDAEDGQSGAAVDRLPGRAGVGGVLDRAEVADDPRLRGAQRANAVEMIAQLRGMAQRGKQHE